MEQPQTKAEIVDEQANGIRVGHRICDRNSAIQIGVGPIRSTHTHKSLHMVGTNREGVGQHRNMDAAHGFGAENLRSPLLECKRTAHMHKLRDAQSGVVQTCTNGGAGHVQQHRLVGVAGRQFVASTVGDPCPHRIGFLEVDCGQDACCFVQFEINAPQRKLEVLGVKTIQSHRIRMRLGGGVLGTRHRLQLQEAQVNALCTKAVKIGCLLGEGPGAVNASIGVAHKHINVGPSDAETSQRPQGQRRSRHKIIEAALLESNGALDIHELRELQCDLACKYTQTFARKVEGNRLLRVSRGNL